MSPAPSFQAGFGKVDITPQVGVELCGYGPYLNRVSTSVLSPLYAKAMAVDDGERRWVLASCDLLALGEGLVGEIRAIVSARSGLPPEAIMVHCTHTHSGPCTVPALTGWGETDPFYLEILPRLVARACLDALGDLSPATLAHAEVPAPGFSYNRELPAPTRTNQAVLKEGWVTDLPEETDTTAHVLKIERAGKLAGFLTYFSCHPVVCGALTREIHGDFVGLATQEVEAAYPGATGLFLQGALGDLNSNYVHGPAEESIVAVRWTGQRFAEVIRDGLAAAKPLEVEAVGFQAGEAPYTVATINREELEEKLAGYEQRLREAGPTGNERGERMALVYARALRSILGPETPAPSPLPVMSFRLGPVSLTAMPLEIMHRIKRRFQAERGPLALLLSTTNGFMGYAPLREYYETPPVRYAPYIVPYMLGRVPYTPAFEEEVLSAALAFAPPRRFESLG